MGHNGTIGQYVVHISPPEKPPAASREQGSGAGYKRISSPWSPNSTTIRPAAPYPCPHNPLTVVSWPSWGRWCWSIEGQILTSLPSEFWLSILPPPTFLQYFQSRYWTDEETLPRWVRLASVSCTMEDTTCFSFPPGPKVHTWITGYFCCQNLRYLSTLVPRNWGIGEVRKQKVPPVLFIVFGDGYSERKWEMMTGV